MSDNEVIIKEVICLANSVKHGGRCIAGVISDNKDLIEWIRPVNPKGKALENNQIKYRNGGYPQPLDIMRVPLKKSQPLNYQAENFIIYDKYWWQKIDNFNFYDLETLVCPPEDICLDCFLFGDGSDRVDTKKFNGIRNYAHSLALIKPKDILFEKRDRSCFGKSPQIRVNFNYGNYQYDLAVTDDSFKNQFYSMNYECGYYRVDKNDIYFTISLGTPIDDKHYKLVASVIINGEYNLIG